MEKTFHIQWHITDRCNLRCLHCYQDDFSSKSEIPLSSLEKIFSNVMDFVEDRKQKLVIDITGGELFLYSHWKELLQMVYQHPAVKKTGIITNGFFLEENTGFLDGFEKLAVKISAEGIKEKTFELFRGKGNYKIFINICKNLKMHLPVREKLLMFTLTKYNLEDVPYLFDFIKEYNFNAFIIERFIPWGRGRKITEALISPAEWLSTLRTLCDRCGLDEDINPLLPYRGFMVSMDKRGYHLFGAPCIVGTDGIAIMPDGTVFPCRRFPLAIGNLLETPLKYIWEQSEVLRKLRNKNFLQGKCKGCKIKNCRGCRAIAYSITGDFLEEDPLCPL